MSGLEAVVASLTRERPAAADDGLFGRSRRGKAALSWRSVLRHDEAPAGAEPEGDDVYEVLEGAVEKVGGRWVPKDRSAAERD